MKFDLERVRLRQKIWLDELQIVFRNAPAEHVEHLVWFAYGMAFMEEVIVEYHSGARTH